jgi:hypothetical protein
MHRPSVSDAEQLALILRWITERMQNNPLPPTASRFSRDELHERDCCERGLAALGRNQIV